MAASDPTKVILVGCGAVPQLYYTPALQELEKERELRVVGFFDPDPASWKKIASSFPTSSHVPHLEQISKLQADLAIVASPPRFHAEQTIHALRSGLAVLCEKPMATSVAEGEAMIEAADATKRVLAIGLFRRFFPATQTIRAALHNEVLGEITSFTCFEGGPFNWPIASLDYFKKSVSKGGVLLDIGVHVLDLMLWWFGEPVQTIYEDDAMGGVEVNCRIRFRFPQGFEGEIRLSREWKRPNHYLIQGTKGWLRWEANEAESVQVGFPSSPFYLNAVLQTGDGRNDAAAGTPARNFQRSFIEQIRNVLAAVRGRGELLVSGREGLQSLRLVEHCYRHRGLMAMPWLGEQERARAEMLAMEKSG